MALWDFLPDDFDQDELPLNELCVPQDAIEDLPWFYNFREENTLLPFEGPQMSLKCSKGRETDVSFVRKVPGKPRNKRAGGRIWSLNSPLPLGGSEVLPMKRCCSHCKAEKTPQWRAGPLGPKTLCNACGVRYKSGRLVPEYRPAASPSFQRHMHSNSHKKIMRMRKEIK